VSSFRSGARLGAVLSQATLDRADEIAIAAIAEEVFATIRATPERRMPGLELLQGGAS
jgi:hypothetical protein